MDLLGVGSAIKATGDALHELFPNDKDKAEAQLAIATLEQKPLLAQALINQLEAQNPNWFTSGWRPAIGWICAFGIGYNYILRPLIAPMLVVFHVHVCNTVGGVETCQQFFMPQLDISELLGLVTGMLGLSYQRTMEKKSNVARN